MQSKKGSKKEVKKVFDFSTLTSEESKKIEGKGYNYCSQSEKEYNDSAIMCCQALPLDQPQGGWMCPHN